MSATILLILLHLLENLGQSKETDENQHFLIFKMCMCALFIDVGILREIKPTGCICPGDILTYEYTVMGSIFGATVWTGSALNCPWGYNGIVLVHNHFTESKRIIKSCHHGAIVARSLYVINNLYTV